MNTTKDEAITGELLPVAKQKRMSAGTLDEHYIDIYLDNPSNKTKALEKAAKAAGIECDTSRQRASEIHRRLQHKIEARLIQRIMDGATLGYSVLYQMAADEETNPSVRAKCASLLIEYAGKNKPDTNSKTSRSRIDIKAEIKKTQIRISQLTGEPL